jgi:hypothetical protein
MTQFRILIKFCSNMIIKIQNFDEKVLPHDDSTQHRGVVASDFVLGRRINSKNPELTESVTWCDSTQKKNEIQGRGESGSGRSFFVFELYALKCG